MKKNHRKFNTSHLEDENLLWCNLRNGDPEALNSLFHKFYQDLFLYGCKISQPDNNNYVIDTIQDVFVNVWETKKTLSDVKNVKAYLFAIFRNKLLKTIIKDGLHKTDGMSRDIKSIGFNLSPEDIYVDNESKSEAIRLIKDLLDELSSKQKEIIYLKFYGNHSNTEIGKILSIEQQSVANLLSRTISLLRKKKKDINFPIFNILIINLL